MNEASDNAMLRLHESITYWATVQYQSEYCSEWRRSFVTSTYNVLWYGFNVADIIWKLISKWLRRYEKDDEATEHRAVFQNFQHALYEKIQDARHTTFDADLQLLSYISLRGQSSSSRLRNIGRRIEDLYPTGDMKIDSIWAVMEKDRADMKSRTFIISSLELQVLV